jgi:YVTN family beta-propeller protein
MKRLWVVLVLALPLAAGSVRVIQTNAAGDAAQFIDPATNKVVLTVKDLEAAHGVTSSPDGTRAYFTVESDSSVVAVDTKTGQRVGKVSLSGHPNNIAVSKDGKLIFAGIAVAPGAVDVIDAATMKNVKSIKVKGAVHNVYVTPDGKWVVSGSVGSRVLTVIDLQKLEIAWEHTFDKGVRCMTFDTAPDGSAAHVYLQLSDVHGFAVLDLKTHEEVARIKLPDEPKVGEVHSGAPSHGIGITPDKKTLAVDSSIANGVFFYSMPDLKVVGFVPTGPTPDWLTFTPDSKMVYIANAGANNVSAVDIQARKVVAVIPVGEVPKRNATVIVP